MSTRNWITIGKVALAVGTLVVAYFNTEDAIIDLKSYGRDNI